MFISENLKVNNKNHLEIGGVDCVSLAEKYGTPLYIMDEDLIRNYCNIYKASINDYYNGNGLVLYASKAFSCKYICKIVGEEGLGLDVVSGGELYTALSANFNPEKIYFHGNNKTYDEIELAVSNNVGRIVVDNIFELNLLNEIAKKHNKTAKISFRIKPGIDAHTHDFVRTGQIDSKFGVALETGEAMEIIKTALKLSNVSVVGVHCHIGSQIFDLAPFELAASVMMNFIADVLSETGVKISELNLGGGFGIKYVPEHDPISYDQYLKAVSKVVQDVANERNIEMPFMVIEPGRSIVAPAGITVYKVGAVKDIPNIRKYVSVDGGMADNPRYIMYQAQYDAVVANKAASEKTTAYTIAGKCCESGDILINDKLLPEIEPSDYLAVLATGAYNYSMASNYNRIPKPPVIMVSKGKDKLVVKRESYDDLIKNDLD